MKKIGIVLIIVISVFMLATCTNSENEKISSDTKDIPPINLTDINAVEPLGNQFNQEYYGNFFINDKKWIYGLDYDIICKISMDDLKGERNVVYGNIDGLEYVSVYDGWIYFLAKDYDTGDFDYEESYTMSLFRIKEGDKKKEMLVDSVERVLVAEEGIYYEGYSFDKKGKDQQGIYVMSFDGSQNKKVLDSKASLVGIDNGWIYYNLNGLHRIKPNGTNNEKIRETFELNKDIVYGGSVENFLINKDVAIFVREKDNDRCEIISKPIDEEEVQLVGDISDTNSINIFGNWLFYNDKNRIYKINIKNMDNPILVHEFKKNVEIESILLNKRGALVTSDDDISWFIKSSGEVIKLGEFD